MYIVKKDGLYLMNYISTGIKEFDGEGNYCDVMTALYSENKRDAMVVESKLIADRLHAEAIPIIDVVTVRKKRR